jgi:membrane protease YdiL (CAAX protease family)
MILWCNLYFLPPGAWALGIPMYVGFVWFMERRKCREFSLGLTAIAQLPLGGGIALAELALPYGFIVVAGHWELSTWAEGLAPIIVSAVLGPLTEEPLVRGVLLRYLELAVGSWWALLATSIGFALAHFAFGPIGFLQWVGIVLGMLAYGAAYLLTRRLWLPLGMHVVYNAALSILESGEIAVTSSERVVFWACALSAEALMFTVLVVLAWRRGVLVSPKHAWTTQVTGRRVSPRSGQADETGQSTR